MPFDNFRDFMEIIVLSKTYEKLKYPLAEAINEVLN